MTARQTAARDMTTPDITAGDTSAARTTRRRTLLTAAAAVATVGALGVALTLTVGTSSSTTPLDATPSPAGETAATPSLPADIVAGRVISRFHPLPWLGRALDDVECPAPLEATVGATLTCTGAAGTDTLDIRVEVTSVDATSVTWEFAR